MKCEINNILIEKTKAFLKRKFDESISMMFLTAKNSAARRIGLTMDEMRQKSPILFLKNWDYLKIGLTIYAME